MRMIKNLLTILCLIGCTAGFVMVLNIGLEREWRRMEIVALDHCEKYGRHMSKSQIERCNNL